MASGGERENIMSENSLMPPLAVFTLPLTFSFSLHLQCLLVLANGWQPPHISILYFFCICACICILYFVERCSCRIMVRGRPALHIAAISASKKVENGQFQKVKTQLSAGDGERGKCKCNIHILLLAKQLVLVANIFMVSSHMSK